MENDIKILRRLAEQYAEIAALPIQKETKKQWHALHRLKPERPMFMIDEIPWNEMNVNDELTNQCTDPFCVEVENNLRRLIYRWNHFRDDYVYDPVVFVPMKINGFNYGLEAEEQTASIDESNVVLSHAYTDQLATEEDLEKLQPPTIVKDEAETIRREQIANEAFGGILEVVMDGIEPYFAPWDRLLEWCGTETWMLNVTARKEFMHKLVDRIIYTHMRMLDALEEGGMLAHSDHLVHCTGAWSDEIPKEGYDPKKPRAKDIWTFGMAQILYMVSPKMHDEYEFQKVSQWYERFALGYYGCCEPLEKRMKYVKKLPNIRKISCSAWVKDYDLFSEQLEGKYVQSFKPNPSHVAMRDAWDPEFVEKELRGLRASADRFGNPMEFTLKDISSVGYAPQTITEWADIMRRIVHE